MLQSSIRRGEMDRTITFIEKVIGSSSSNEDQITGWIEIDTDPVVTAKRVDLKGTDVVIADRMTYMQSTKYIIDHRTDLTTEMRVVEDGRVFEIIAITINNSSRDMYLDVMCNLLDTEVWT